MYSEWAQQNGREICLPNLCGKTSFHCHGPISLCDLIDTCLKFNVEDLNSRDHGRPSASQLKQILLSMTLESWSHEKVFSLGETNEVQYWLC